MRSRIIPILVAFALPALAQEIDGRVLEDTSGEPLVNAELRFHKAGMHELAADLETERDGRFHASGIPAGEYTVDVLKPNHITTTLTLRVPATGLLVRLVRYAVIAGTVRDTEGKPLPGRVTLPTGRTSGSARIAVLVRQPGMEELKAVRQVPLGDGGRGERGGARSDIPGVFTIDAVFPDDYGVHAFFYAPGMYVKDVTFSGRSVMYEPLRPATAMGGAGLRVVMAHDGATLNVQVNDKDGNPAVDLRVLVIPGDVHSEGELAARLVEGQTNQAGQYTTQTLPPGKYYVVATEESVDPTPESIDRLWRSRNRFQEVDLPPAGSAQVKLEPGKIE